MIEDSYQPLERRPLASRQWPVWQHVVAWLVRRQITPNTISVWGMFCALLAGGALALTSRFPEWGTLLWLLAAVGIQLRLLANLLDGMVAIAAGSASPVGELYNEVPDRISDAAVLIGAGYAVGGNITLGYLATCGALLTAYIRAMGKAAGAPQEYCGPMAKPQRMAVLTIAAVVCLFVPMEILTKLQGNFPGGVMAVALWIVFLGCLFTFIRRLRKTAHFLRKTQP